jgi:hypothetical protein
MSIYHVWEYTDNHFYPWKLIYSLRRRGISEQTLQAELSTVPSLQKEVGSEGYLWWALGETGCIRLAEAWCTAPALHRCQCCCLYLVFLLWMSTEHRQVGFSRKSGKVISLREKKGPDAPYCHQWVTRESEAEERKETQTGLDCDGTMWT